MLSLDFFAKRLGNVVPNKDVYSKRQVALFERIPQVAHLPTLARSRERNQVKIRRWPRSSFHPRSIGPDLGFRQVGVE